MISGKRRSHQRLIENGLLSSSSQCERQPQAQEDCWQHRSMTTLSWEPRHPKMPQCHICRSKNYCRARLGKKKKKKVVPKYSRNETAGAMDTFRSVLSSRKLTQNGGQRHDQISSAFYTYDVQATLTNLRTRGLQEDLACTLCEQLGKTLNMFYHSTFP